MGNVIETLSHLHLSLSSLVEFQYQDSVDIALQRLTSMYSSEVIDYLGMYIGFISGHKRLEFCSLPVRGKTGKLFKWLYSVMRFEQHCFHG